MDEQWQSAREARSNEQDKSFIQPLENVPPLIWHKQQVGEQIRKYRALAAQ